MKYYPAPLFALQTLILQDIPRSLKTKKDASFTGETRTGKRSRPCVNHLQMSTPFKLLFNFRNRVNVDHPPFRCRHVVVSASRNRRRRKEAERRSNREVPPSNKSAPDESKHNTVSKGADEPFTSYNSLYKFDSFSKERSSVEIIEKDTFRTEAEGVFFSSLNTLLSVDYLLLFGVDGVLPEIINGRCAMIGLLLGFANEVMTKKSLNEQLVFNVTHGVTPLIAIMVILFSLVPSFLINQDKHMVEPGSQNVRNPQGWFGQGAFRYKFDERFRGRRAYAVDPAVSDWKIFQMKTPLGHIGCVPFAEVVNARFAMFVLAGTFFIEGFLGHGILSS